MKRTGWIVAVAALCASTVWAGGGLGVMYSYWDTKDMDNGQGGGIKLKGDLAEAVAIELRASYLFDFGGDPETEDFTIAPLEADLVLQIPLGDMLKAYGGGGAGYYVTPEFESKAALGDSEEPDVDPEDAVGYFAVGGVELGVSETAALFVEAKYTWLEIDKVEVDGIEIADVEGKLDGLGINAGIMVRW